MARGTGSGWPATGWRTVDSASRASKLNLPGCYRALVATPRNFTHRLPSQGTEEEEEEGSEETRRGTIMLNALPSLVLNFDLPSSSYATVCLREMMKSTRSFPAFALAL
ncbi:LOW QUALITY PROTEIN: hypothetical protein CRUP_006533 [Coryphaenoides rupestris]|nr:LOW QUALITY PROTEIN: hypothetical protein CRUP_006533 [Coryphaenoides rupestris]